jgi:hypothetical protein
MAVVSVDTPVTYLLYDTLTGLFIETLPFRGVTFGGGPVNSAGSFTGNLDLQDPGIQNTDWVRATAPNKTTLIIDYNGEIVWGGPISGRKETFNAQGFQLEIDAQEGNSWWSHVVQATDYSSPPYSGITGPYSAPGMPVWNRSFLTLGIGYTDCGPPWGNQPFIWDPMLIGAQVMLDALSVPNGGLWGIDVHGNPTNGLAIALNGVVVNGDNGIEYIGKPEWTSSDLDPTGTRTPFLSYIQITFPYTSLMTLSSILQQLTSLGYGIGFDMAIDWAYTTSRYSPIQATMNLSYPRRGRILSPTGSNLTINLGSAHDWTFPEDGTAQGSINFETGGNQDIAVIENIYPGGTGTYGGYPNTALVHNIANLNSPNPTVLLQHMGLSDSVLYSWPPVAPQVTVDMFSDECGLGTFIVGDDVNVVVPSLDQDGNVFDPRFPTGMIEGMKWRIASYQATVADEGDCLITYTLDTPPDYSLDPDTKLRQTPTLP